MAISLKYAQKRLFINNKNLIQRSKNSKGDCTRMEFFVFLGLKLLLLLLNKTYIFLPYNHYLQQLRLLFTFNSWRPSASNLSISYTIKITIKQLNLGIFCTKKMSSQQALQTYQQFYKSTQQAVLSHIGNALGVEGTVGAISVHGINACPLVLDQCGDIKLPIIAAAQRSINNSSLSRCIAFAHNCYTHAPHFPRHKDFDQLIKNSINWLLNTNNNNNLKGAIAVYNNEDLCRYLVKSLQCVHDPRNSIREA